MNKEKIRKAKKYKRLEKTKQYPSNSLEEVEKQAYKCKETKQTLNEGFSTKNFMLKGC